MAEISNVELYILLIAPTVIVAIFGIFGLWLRQ